LKIAFWSPIAGKSGTTSNLLASAVMSSVILKKSIFILHNHFSDYSLEKALIGKNAGPGLFEDIGLDSLLRNVKIPDLSESIIDDSAISLFNNRLHLLPGTTKEYRDQFESEMPERIPDIINTVNRYYDLVFMDLAPGYGIQSQILLENADLIVVNLIQDVNSIDNYFAKYHFSKKKVVYLIGRYNNNSRYNLKNLEKSYHGIRQKTAVIPYNVEFMDAVLDGRLIPYIIKNYAAGRGEDNLYFIKRLKQAVGLIWDCLMRAGEIS
jgi:cellulose biosynthesis protein BcsQ